MSSKVWRVARDGIPRYFAHHQRNGMERQMAVALWGWGGRPGVCSGAEVIRLVRSAYWRGSGLGMSWGGYGFGERRFMVI